ncbi:MAG: DUF5719 family protein [Nostocoides sp.]
MNTPSRPTVTRTALAALRIVVVAGAAGGVIQAAHATSWTADLSTVATAQGAASAATALTRSTVICPGGELSGIQGVKDIAVPARIAAAAAPADLVRTLLGRAPGAGTLGIGATGGPGVAAGPGSAAGPGAGATTTSRATIAADAPASGAAQVTGAGGLAPGIVATQEWRADGLDLRGLVSVACGAAVNDAWFVAGGGDPGRQERLVLVNPGANVVTADIALLGAAGPIVSPNGNDVVVPARGRATVLLDAISSAEKTPVVHVRTAGGLVYAAVNDTWTDGSVAAGSDDVSPAAAPATSVVIPAVAVGGTTRVRVAVPGTHDAVVQVRTIDTGGGSPLPRGGVATIRAGSVGEFDLSGLAAGTYAVQVTADEPVVAGAIAIRRDQAGPGDFAWSSATAPISQVAGLAFVPTSGAGALTRVLTLVSSGDPATVEVTTVDAAGAATVASVKVPADSTASVALPAGTSQVWVRRTAGDGDVRGAVVSTGGSGPTQLIATTPLASAPLTTLTTRVLPLP